MPFKFFNSLSGRKSKKESQGPSRYYENFPTPQPHNSPRRSSSSGSGSWRSFGRFARSDTSSENHYYPGGEKYMYQQRDYRPPRGVTVVEAPEEYDSNDGSAGYSPRSESESSQSTASRPSRERALIDALEDPRGEVDEHAEPERSMSPSTVDDAASPVVEEPQEPTPMPMPAPMPLYTPVPGPLPMPMPQADPVVLPRAMSPTSVTSSSRSRGPSYRRERSVDARRARVETDNESEDSYEHELERETESRRGYHSRRYEPPVESRSRDRTYSDRSYSRSERRDHDRSTSHSHSRSRHDEDRRHYPEVSASFRSVQLTGLMLHCRHQEVGAARRILPHTDRDQSHRK
ncbi:hypothetical protein SISSUDRAFT_919850 [Sistotremastrum suecicum HHB10207 ss-3]|uniref:Uncharacterized protein n=1 Tax=Sistotremastrum suecicum HHB10207 ss-3 TaxID=1314776 RepID=A0A166BVZ9_9AGAM|nr:hypothetical protein SISSUDRAFT_919850 [Sistotremastrum suecicum HHB10207 ss-3]